VGGGGGGGSGNGSGSGGKDKVNQDAASDIAESASGWRRFLNSPALRAGRQCVVPDLARVGAAVEDDVLNSTLPRGGHGNNNAVDADALPLPPSPLELARAGAEGAKAAAAGASGGARPEQQQQQQQQQRRQAWRRRYPAVDWLGTDVSWLHEPEFSSIMLQVGPGARPAGAAARLGAAAISGAAFLLLGVPSWLPPQTLHAIPLCQVPQHAFAAQHCAPHRPPPAPASLPPARNSSPPSPRLSLRRAPCAPAAARVVSPTTCSLIIKEPWWPWGFLQMSLPAATASLCC
jgi:hypothetical protein